MNNIITETNCIRINDTLIPKNSVRIVQILNGVRILFNTGVTQDLKVSESKIDGVDVASAEELFEFFKAQSFNVGGGSVSEGAVISVNGKDGNVVLTRADIGAGTSNLELGTTSTTALKGDTELLMIGNTSTTAMAGNRQFASVEQGLLADNAASKIDFDNALINKVDKADGFGLSQTSFTQSEKTKLSTIVEHYAGRFLSLTDLNAIIGVTGGYAYVSINSAPTVLYAWNGQTSTWDSTVLAASEESPETIKTKYESNADTNSYTDTEKAKLLGVASEATKNQTDAYLLSLANQTGSLPLSKVTDLSLIITTINNTNDSQNTAIGNKEPIFSKGSIIQGQNVTLTGNLTGRLVGSGDVTINNTSTGSSGGLDDMIQSPTYFWDFGSAPSASINFAPFVLQQATWSYNSGENSHPGIAVLNKTSTGGSGGCFLLFNTIGSLFIRGGEEFKCSFKPIQLSTSASGFKIGFIDQYNFSTAHANAVYIDYQTVNSTMYANTLASSVKTTVTMSDAIAHNNWYTIRIVVSSDKASALFELYDDSKVLITSTTISTNIPTLSTQKMTAGISAIGNAGISGVICHLDYMAVKLGNFPNR